MTFVYLTIVSLLKALQDGSQTWADHIASIDKFSHRTERKHNGEQMGENIAMKWTSSGDDFTGQQCTDQWYSEIERYDFKANSGPRTGSHFLSPKR